MKKTRKINGLGVGDKIGAVRLKDGMTRLLLAEITGFLPQGDARPKSFAIRFVDDNVHGSIPIKDATVVWCEKTRKYK